MRLIDADVLKEKLEKTADINNPKFSYDSMMIAKITIQVLDKAPTVEERKQGHWIRHNNIIACSECIFDMCFDENIAELNYCPYCGAKMDGEPE